MSANNKNVREHTCAWCAQPIQATGRGRPRKYCSHSCRQRAYEQRNNVSGTSIPENAVILSPSRAADLSDLLFQLRCAAEDIKTAVQEHAEGEEINVLCDEVVRLATTIERLRMI